MPPPSLIARLHDEQQRLVFGLQVCLYSDLSLLVLMLVFDPEARADMLPGFFIFGAFLAFTWWQLVPTWLELRPPGRWATWAYALTIAGNVLVVAALAAGYHLFSWIPVVVGLALAVAVLVARIVVGARSRAEQKELQVYTPRRTPPGLSRR